MNPFKFCYLCFFILMLTPLTGVALKAENVTTLNVEDSARINKLLNDAKAFEEKKDYERAVEAVL
ncbi:MAG: hypothetical protein ABI208_03670, partial [Ginsengibacter sp.]